MIDFYTAGTPNGYKVSIALEELELDYELHSIDLAADEQKTTRVSPDQSKWSHPSNRRP